MANVHPMTSTALARRSKRLNSEQRAFAQPKRHLVSRNATRSRRGSASPVRILAEYTLLRVNTEKRLGLAACQVGCGGQTTDEQQGTPSTIRGDAGTEQSSTDPDERASSARETHTDTSLSPTSEHRGTANVTLTPDAVDASVGSGEVATPHAADAGVPSDAPTSSVIDPLPPTVDDGGKLAWVVSAAGDGHDLWTEARGITLTRDAVFIAGRFSGYATFVPGEREETTLTDTATDDLFVAKYWL